MPLVAALASAGALRGFSAKRALVPTPKKGIRALARQSLTMLIVPWMQPLFRDRAAAGRELAEALSGRSGVVVGVARGGVAVAAEVARELELPLTAVDVERVNAHGRRLGATTAHGPPYLLVPEPAVEDFLARARRRVLGERRPDPDPPTARRGTLAGARRRQLLRRLPR